MRVPNTINANTFTVYVNPAISTRGSKLHGDNFQWDQNVPKYLREICLEAIARNWTEKPILRKIPRLEDRFYLVDILSTELPLEKTVPIIQYDVYWKRCYKARWPKEPPLHFPDEEVHTSYFSSLSSSKESFSSATSSKRSSRSSKGNSCEEKKTWKHYYMEKHVREYLEKLKPEDYDPEKIKILCDIFAPYVRTLDLREMQAPESNSGDRIPLSSILTGLPKITDLSLCFQQAYVGDSFSWHIFKTTTQDVTLLCKGLQQSDTIRSLRIIKSDIDCAKFTKILQSLRKNDVLKQIDFSHCQISDAGILKFCKFLPDHSSLQIVDLTNNRVGTKGAKALAYTLSKPECALTELNLRLNNIGNEGANFVFEVLALPGQKLRELGLAACGLTDGVNVGMLLRNNTSLDSLNLSNNKIGESSGKNILDALKENTTLTQLDLRMCCIRPETHQIIRLQISENNQISRLLKRAESALPQKESKSSCLDLFYEEFVSEIENQVL